MHLPSVPAPDFWALLVLLSGTPFKVLSSLLPINECGKRPLMNQIPIGTRIVGGHDAEVGAWPWQIFLFYPRNPSFWRITIGLHHLHEYNSRTVTRRVRAITIHSNYTPQNYENDIALFTLIKSIKYNDYIQPICLPDINLFINSEYPCYITGWGNTKEKGRERLVLQEARVRIIPLTTCNRNDWYGGKITFNMLCAGSESGHVDSCQGDSGGPLVCYIPKTSRFYLIGITSFGYGCGRPKHPGVYVRSANYRRWIDANLLAKTTTVNFGFFPVFLTVGWAIFHIVS
ncbi:Transmembrane protease serine 12 [Varanus komodoensis]|nr:Transmembrane protease serine 12 [Varanus komodoensis]